MIHGFTGVPNFEELLSQSPHLPQYISHYKKYIDCERNKIMLETPMWGVDVKQSTLYWSCKDTTTLMGVDQAPKHLHAIQSW